MCELVDSGLSFWNLLSCFIDRTCELQGYENKHVCCSGASKVISTDVCCQLVIGSPTEICSHGELCNWNKTCSTLINHRTLSVSLCLIPPSITLPGLLKSSLPLPLPIVLRLLLPF